MEDVLQNILKIGLFICVSYAMGLAARLWWEVKIFLIFVLGAVLLGVFSHSLISETSLWTGRGVLKILPYIVSLAPLGYLTAPPIISYFEDPLERFLSSDEFDSTYRQYAKRHKTAFANDDKDAFQHFHQTYQTEARSHSGAYYDQRRSHSSTSYEDYSQYRRSQSKAERSAPPPRQDYRSDKDKMFDVLEVSDKSARAKELKSAYRKLAWKYHPDVLAKTELSDTELDAAEARMQEINHAYDWLKDNGFAE